MWQSLFRTARCWLGRRKKVHPRRNSDWRSLRFERVELRQLLTTLSILSEPLAENAAGGFWLIRNGDVTAPLDVHVQVSSAAAAAGSDFTAVDRTVQFPAQQSQLWVEVQHLDDNLAETVEGYAIAATANDGASTTGQGWIRDNDGSDSSSGSGSASGSASGSLWVLGSSNAENGAAGFWVGRNGDVSASLDVEVAVDSGTATAGSDFMEFHRTVHLNAGQSQAWVEVQHLDDSLIEPAERYLISALTNDGRAAGGEGWILDNDGAGSGSGSGTGTGSGTASTSGTSPVITGFACVLSGGNLTITGSVTDNVDPTGYWVCFGDLLQGRSVQVLADNTFELIITGWSQHGDISAWVTDSTMLTSQLVWDVV